VRELRFCCCNVSQSGAPVREFFRSNYAELKKLNPAFPLLLREGTGADPYLLATYGKYSSLICGISSPSS
ncbi:unnamed protein product, partial [Hapterophycus canaliculatus]